MRVFQFLNVLFSADDFDITFRHDAAEMTATYDAWQNDVMQLSIDKFREKYPFWDSIIERLYFSKKLKKLVIVCRSF